MSWLRIDDGFATNWKVSELTDRDFRTWVRTLCYAAQNKATNGQLSARNRAEIPGLTAAVLTRFHRLQLLDETEVKGTYIIHDWKAYNPDDSTAAERMRAYRARNADRNGDRNDDRNETVTRAQAQRAFPSRPLTTTPLSQRHGESGLDEQEKGRQDEIVATTLQARADFDSDEQARLAAWQERAAAPDIRSPGAFVRSGMASGGWPDPPPADARPVNMPPADAAPGWSERRIACLIRNGVIADRFELDDEIQRAGLDPGEAGSLVAQFDLARQLNESEEET